MDYGHPVEFGLFITPTADRTTQVLELADLAEAIGLDLVAIQDHPYQRRFLDTWTLLSAVGARTRSIRLAPDVASLPLRPPVVLAKSAASLDLITGGRFELGLGAGSFWDAIAGAGGPRRTPKEAVDALVEAIEILRGMWEGGPFSFTGEHYQVRGIKAGPVPAHPIGIWLGAYKPRMLRVTGQLADGWLPSLGQIRPAELGTLNAQIDEAAVDAGRDPRVVRRLVNIHGSFGNSAELLRGTPTDWSEQLADLALAFGMSTFILATDDPDEAHRYAEEVAPRVRELVTAERAPSSD
ncbi:MAG TPA: LLM class flavin-dependent oxidoreductase [Propionibacteriaceae bacterium]|nr:LLM class flavin-dependent oxidoreductase [Propionibacteriaceae bacterium]